MRALVLKPRVCPDKSPTHDKQIDVNFSDPRSSNDWNTLFHKIELIENITSYMTERFHSIVSIHCLLVGEQPPKTKHVWANLEFALFPEISKAKKRMSQIKEQLFGAETEIARWRELSYINADGYLIDSPHHMKHFVPSFRVLITRFPMNSFFVVKNTSRIGTITANVLASCLLNPIWTSTIALLG